MLFSEQFNFIYFGPKSGKDKSVPFIVIPHGGPHSSFTNIFSLDHSFLVSAGIMVINHISLYRHTSEKYIEHR